MVLGLVVVLGIVVMGICLGISLVIVNSCKWLLSGNYKE